MVSLKGFIKDPHNLCYEVMTAGIVKRILADHSCTCDLKFGNNSEALKVIFKNI